MRVRALSGTGDWLFGKGQNDFLVNNAAVVQNIGTRLKSFLGDCFFDLGAGIDWFTFLGSKDQIGLNLAVSAVILNTENVTGIKQLSIVLNRTTRKITISYQAVSTYSSMAGLFEFDLNGIG